MLSFVEDTEHTGEGRLWSAMDGPMDGVTVSYFIHYHKPPGNLWKHCASWMGRRTGFVEVGEFDGHADAEHALNLVHLGHLAERQAAAEKAREGKAVHTAP